MKSYKALLRKVLELGENHSDRTGVGTTSLFGCMWEHDMRDGFPLLTTKKMPARLVFEELLWFIRGSSQASELQERDVHIWDEWATKEQCAKFNREEGQLGPIYGPMWRRFPTLDGDTKKQGIDQLDRLLNNIKSNPGSRRHLVTAWHPECAANVTLPPCHWAFQVKCHEDEKEMSMLVQMRSVDLFLGMPFDIASYAFLLTMICQVTGYKPRMLKFSLGDTHIYHTHASQVDELLSRTPMGLPHLVITKPDKYLPSLQQLESYHWEMVKLHGYDPQPTIKAPVAV